MMKLVIKSILWATVLCCSLSAAGQCDPQWSSPFVNFRVSAGTYREMFVQNIQYEGESWVAITGDYVMDLNLSCNTDVLLWDGHEFRCTTSVGQPMYNTLQVVSYDQDGDGPLATLMYARTASGQIFEYNGASWRAIGTAPGTGVRWITIYDDGRGPSLFYVGGFNRFVLNTGTEVPAYQRARWDGVSWEILAAPEANVVYQPWDLVAIQSGSNQGLYIAGAFQPQQHIGLIGGIGRWNLDGTISMLGSFPQGESPRSVVEFQDHIYCYGDSWLARWDGSSWTYVTQDIRGSFIYDAKVFNDGTGDKLYLFGIFDRVNNLPAERSVAWDGQNWIYFRNDLAPFYEDPWTSGLNSWMTSPAAIDFGDGLYLHAVFINYREDAQLVRLEDGQWRPVTNRVPVSTLVYALLDEGNGPVLYAGAPVAPEQANYVEGKNYSLSRWNGEYWENSPKSWFTNIYGNSNVLIERFLRHDDGTGPATYMAGVFQFTGLEDSPNIVRWDGQQWSGVGNGLPYNNYSGEITNLISTTKLTGEPLLLAAYAPSTNSSTNPSSVMQWDGSHWQSLGSFDGIISNLLVHDDGTGPALYAAGDFSGSVGTPTESHGASFKPAGWEELDAQLADAVDFDILPTPTGGQLVAAHLSSSRASIFLKEAGQWTQLGDDFNAREIALLVHDFGDGPTIYVGIDIINHLPPGSASPPPSLFGWDGSQWQPVADNPTDKSSLLASFQGSIYRSSVSDT